MSEPSVKRTFRKRATRSFKIKRDRKTRLLYKNRHGGSLFRKKSSKLPGVFDVSPSSKTNAFRTPSATLAALLKKSSGDKDSSAPTLALRPGISKPDGPAPSIFANTTLKTQQQTATTPTGTTPYAQSNLRSPYANMTNHTAT